MEAPPEAVVALRVSVRAACANPPSGCRHMAASPAGEVAELVEPEVAEGLDPDKRYGVFWFGKSRQKLTYGRRRKRMITQKDPDEWVAIPVPDCGVPPEWILAARKRLQGNTRWPLPDDPD